MEFDWEAVLAAISGVGALGLAAYGVVEAFGKAFAGRIPGLGPVGLPYAGFTYVDRLMRPLAPALRVAHGDEWRRIVLSQYRDGRGRGEAPDTIRQGVRLGLPYLPPDDAALLINRVWGLMPDRGQELARTLESDLEQRRAKPAPAARDDEAMGPSQETLALIARFATALDAQVSAAFAVAEERYVAIAKFSAGVTAVIMALAFNWMWPLNIAGVDPDDRWLLALLIGLVAVPLAPVTNDLVDSLSRAARAWRGIGART